MCSLEFPDLETAFWQRYRDRGLQVFGVARILGVGGDTDEVVRAFIDQTGVTFPILRDPAGYPLFSTRRPDSPGRPTPSTSSSTPRVGSVASFLEYRPEALRAVIEPLLP